MSNLSRRLRKLEAQLTDNRGLIPHSPQWLAHWMDRVARIVGGEDDGTPSCIPLEAVDAILVRAKG